MVAEHVHRTFLLGKLKPTPMLRKIWPIRTLKVKCQNEPVKTYDKGNTNA